MGKKLPAVILLLTLLFLPTRACWGEKGVAILIEGKTSDYMGIFIENVFYAPARVLADTLEAELEWLGILKLLQFNLEGRNVRLREGDTYMQVANRILPINAPIIIEDKMWVPLLEVLSPFDYKGALDAPNKTLHITRDRPIIKEVLFEPRYQTLTITATDSFPYSVKAGDVFFLETFTVMRDKNFIVDLGGEEGVISEQETLQISFDLPFLPEPESVRETWVEAEFRLVFSFPTRLTNVGYRQETGELILHAAGNIMEYELFELQNPHRLVLDLPAILAHQGDLPPDFRISQYEQDPPTVRLVVPAKEDVEYRVWNPDESTLIISWGAERTYIDDIYWAKEHNKGLVIVSNGPVQIKAFTLVAPLRMVFDLPNTVLRGDIETVKVDEGPVRQMRVSQFDRNTVRVVLDLNYLPQYRITHWEEDEYLTRVSFQNELLRIVQEKGITREHYHLQLSGAVEYEVGYLPSPDRVVIDIKDSVIALQGDLPGEGGMVKGVRVSQFSRNPDIVRVVFDLHANPQFDVLSPSTSDLITLEFPRSSLTGRTIAIDAGHGGMDPGAIGPMNTYEKDIVLDISLRLRDLLLKAGATPVMTRETDEFINLWRRSDIANRAQADIFISIHANAVARDIPEGTETYITRHSSSLTTRLAQVVHQEVTQSLGLRDRGIKYKNFQVLENLRMPGILLEVAFISNPVEEKLLRNPDFRQKVAESIFRGLVNYFSQLRLGER